MFEKMDLQDREIIYRALKHMVDSSCGIGFQNSDQGHPTYVHAADGTPDSEALDGPDENRVFAMLSELSKDLKEHDHTGYVWWYDFSDWQDFCKFAFDAYNRCKHHRKPS